MRGGKSKIQSENTGKRLAVVARSVLAQLRTDPEDRGSSGDDSRPPFDPAGPDSPKQPGEDLTEQDYKDAIKQARKRVVKANGEAALVK